MTKEELRKRSGYIEAVEKIRNYSKGFTFTLDFSRIPKAKANALRIVLKDCENMGLIESISFGLDIQGNLVEEEYKRI